jgi:flagellar hook-associated protein 3 FlgL
MRITQRAVAQTSLQGLNANMAALAKLQQQLTSGRTISKPSDSPVGTNKAMQLRQAQSATDQQARNISDGKGWLDAADTALTSMSTQINRVRDLAVQGANTGASSPAAREALAAEMDSLREGLLGVANQTIGGRPIFGGATVGSVAYDAAGKFVGVGGKQTLADGTVADITIPLNRRVSDSEENRIDITGPEAFGDRADGDDLFAVITKAAAAVRDGSDPAAISAGIKALDEAKGRLVNAAADIGARTARLEKVEQVNADRKLTLKTQLSEVEEIDLPKTVMELNLQQTGYEAALSATAKAIQPSLVDFLR